jgi:hypothetical protein
MTGVLKSVVTGIADGVIEELGLVISEQSRASTTHADFDPLGRGNNSVGVTHQNITRT